MTRRPLLALLLALLLAPASAFAAACCVLAAPGRSGRLPEKEVFGALVAYSMEGRPGAWDSKGDLSFAARDLQFTHTLTTQLLARPHRVFQGGVAVPLLLNASRYGDNRYVGGGLGDITLLARWEPVAVGGFRSAPPLPGIGLGLALPTGRATHQIDAGNPAAVTGTGYFAFTPSFSLDKAYERGTLGGDVSVTLSPPRPGDADRNAPGIGFSASLFGSFFASSRVTVTTTLGVRGSGPGFRKGQALGGPQLEPLGGVGLVLEPKPRHRLVLGLQGSVPIPQLGLSRAVAITASLGGSFSVARKVRAP